MKSIKCDFLHSGDNLPAKAALRATAATAPGYPDNPARLQIHNKPLSVL